MSLSPKRVAIQAFHRMPRTVQRGAAAACRLLPLGASMGKGYDFVRRLLRGTRDFDRRRLLEFQFERFREIYRHAVREIPYYRKWYGEHGLDENSLRSPDDIASLPLLNKDRVRGNLEDLTWPDFPRSRVFPCKTGGTTGNPVVVNFARFNIQAQVAFVHNLWGRIGFRPRDFTAIFCRNEYSMPRDGLLQFYNIRDNILCLSLDYLKIDLVEKYIRVFHEMRPDYLMTFPATMFIFAQMVRELGASLPPMRGVMCHAQKFLPGQRRVLEEVFGCPVYSHYGQAERVILGGECEYSQDYHVVPEYGWTEIVDGEGNPISKPGRVGELVGTGFHNRVMPLIRYRTGDLACFRKDQSCRCGRPHLILDRLKGRIQEFLVMADGTLKGATAGSPQFGIFVEYARGFQLVQEVPGRVEIHIVPRRDNPPGYRKKMREELQKYFGPIEFEVVETGSLEKTASGKPRFLIQKLKTPQSEGSETFWLDDFSGGDGGGKDAGSGEPPPGTEGMAGEEL